MQAIPRGQYEGAQALGLGYWKMMGLIILPQALRITIPNIVNSNIALFKDTTLVFIVGIFDFLRTIEVARIDPKWATPVTSTTGYAFAAIFYFVCCWMMSRYARGVERRLATGYKRRGTVTAMHRQQGAAMSMTPRCRRRVEIVGMHKWFGDFHVLRDINLTVRVASAS